VKIFTKIEIFTRDAQGKQPTSTCVKLPYLKRGKIPKIRSPINAPRKRGQKKKSASYLSGKRESAP